MTLSDQKSGVTVSYLQSKWTIQFPDKMLTADAVWAAEQLMIAIRLELRPRENKGSKKPQKAKVTKAAGASVAKKQKG